MNKILEPLAKDAVDLRDHRTIEQMEACLRDMLLNPPEDSAESIRDEVYAYAARQLVGEYIRKHRHDPIIAQISPQQGPDESTGEDDPELDEDGVRVRTPDPNFTPQPRTPEERDRLRNGFIRSLFEFRINQAGRMISIWNARRETLEVEVHKRQKQVDGIMRNIDFLTALVERLQPGQNAKEAGITNEEMWAIFRGVTEATE